MFNNTDRKNNRLTTRIPDTLNIRIYNLILGGLILYGFIINAFIVVVSEDLFLKVSPLVFLIGYFVCAMIGCIISEESDSPFMSFIGYNLVVLPIGALLSVCLKAYELGDIFSAIIITGIVVAGMLLFAVICPKFFEGMGRTLFFSLLIGIVIELIATLMGYGGDVFNWFFVIVFSLYIGYDWCKAQSYPKTLDNAIDSALDIYLDIINLFIRILEILAENDD